MERESVRFTSQMVTVFVQHEKMISKVLKRCHDLTATEFCILREIYLAGGEVDGLDFADFLMLKRNSISMAISSLSRKGYVEKSPSSNDRRMASIFETSTGTEVTRAATKRVYEAQRSTFWRNLSVDDERSGNVVASLVLRRLRGQDYATAAPLKETNTPITPEFIIFCKVVPQRWSCTIKEVSNLSLTDFRILDHVSASEGEIRAADVAQALLLERSLISSCKNGLVRQGLLHEQSDISDGRNSFLSATSTGEALAAKLNAALGEATADMYALCDERLVFDINEWHPRMYRSMNVMNQLI